MNDDLVGTINAALAGDTSAVPLLADHERVTAAAQPLGPLILTPRAVARVVSDYADGRITRDAAQQWATWVRHGYVPGTGLPARPTEVDWPDDEYDDAIATATMRLEELGDIIDGELRPGEADQLLAALRG